MSLGTKVNLNNAFHHQTDGYREHTIHTFEDMRRECVIHIKGVWMITFHSLSSLIIRANIVILGLNLLKHCMAGDIGP